MSARNPILVALTVGALLGAACSVSLGDKLKYACSKDADCGGDGYACTTIGGASFCCKASGAEICDGLDNDCDGVTDNGFDLKNDRANCGTCTHACATAQTCSNGACVDHALNCNDGNDHCAEAGCNLQSCGPGCECTSSKKSEILCSDGVDNDGDTLVDCADPDCEARSCGDGCACKSSKKTESICSDGKDNDLDTRIDCEDEDCVGAVSGTGTACAADGGARETACGDAVDNNHNGFTDCLDPDCTLGVCATFTGGGNWQCNAGVCNCHGGSGAPENSDALCSDGIDNDCNGKSDCADSSCNAKACPLDGGTGSCSAGRCQ